VCERASRPVCHRFRASISLRGPLKICQYLRKPHGSERTIASTPSDLTHSATGEPDRTTPPPQQCRIGRRRGSVATLFDALHSPVRRAMRIVILMSCTECYVADKRAISTRWKRRLARCKLAGESVRCAPDPSALNLRCALLARANTSRCLSVLPLRRHPVTVKIFSRDRRWMIALISPRAARLARTNDASIFAIHASPVAPPLSDHTARRTSRPSREITRRSS